MNKTITVNIAGFVFYIEEDAYSDLKAYIDTIKQYLNKTEGRDEIIADVESRIAELFQERNNAKEVVVMSDVEDVIAIMGKPEAYLDEDSQFQESANGSEQQAYSEKKKFFRDPDDKVIGGVCAGIGHYFNLDPLWVRLGLVALFLIFGFGIILYLLLWAIIPLAHTTAEKLQMKGQHVTVENIKKSVKREVDDLKKNFNNEGTRKAGQRLGSAAESLGSGLASFFKFIFKVFGKLLGLFFIIGGIMIIVGLFGLLFGSDTIFNIFGTELDYDQIEELIFHGSGNLTISLITIATICIIPALLLLYWGSQILSNNRVRVPGLALGLFSLLIIGSVVAGVYALKVSKNYWHEAEIVKLIDLPQEINQFYIAPIPDEIFSEHLNPRRANTLDLLTIKNDSLYNASSIRVRVAQSQNGRNYLESERSCLGPRQTEATYLAERIQFDVEVKDSVIWIPTYTVSPIEDAYRAQEAIVTLYLTDSTKVDVDDPDHRLHFRNWTDRDFNRDKDFRLQYDRGALKISIE